MIAKRPGLGLSAAVTAFLVTGCAAPRAKVLARGVLPYALAEDAGHLVSLELTERFELVVRAPTRELRRIDLGPAELDVRALAVHQGLAYVGDDAGWVREVSLATASVRQLFATGAPVHALAVDARYLVTADKSGALCLRRRTDLALLQCARAPFPIHSLAITGDRMALTSDTHAAIWLVPSLAAIGEVENLVSEYRFREGAAWAVREQLWWRGGGQTRQLATMASAIRQILLTSSGALVVAAWPRRLDDPALLYLTP